MIISLIFLIANLIMTLTFVSMLHFMVRSKKEKINIGITVSLFLISFANLLYFVEQAVN